MNPEQMETYHARLGAATTAGPERLEPTLIDDVQRTFGDVYQLVDRLENLVFRCLGPVPEPASSGVGVATKTEGLLNELVEGSERLRDRIARGHSALSRLEARLG